MDLTRDEYTDYLYDLTCFSEPIMAVGAEDVTDGINRAMELDIQPVFLEGVSARLSQLGIPCTSDDTGLMLTEIKRKSGRRTHHA